MVGIAYSLRMIVVGRYLAILCEGEEEDAKASYFSIYGVFAGLSGILPPVVSLFSLGFFGSDIFLCVLMTIEVVATVFGSFALEDLDDSQQPNVCQPGLILPNLKKVVEFYPVLWNVVPLIMLSGVVMGVISFTMMHFLPAGQDSERISSYGTFFNGLGALIFGYLCGEAQRLLHPQNLQLLYGVAVRTSMCSRCPNHQCPELVGVVLCDVFVGGAAVWVRQLSYLGPL